MKIENQDIHKYTHVYVYRYIYTHIYISIQGDNYRCRDYFLKSKENIINHFYLHIWNARGNKNFKYI